MGWNGKITTAYEVWRNFAFSFETMKLYLFPKAQHCKQKSDGFDGVFTYHIWVSQLIFTFLPCPFFVVILYFILLRYLQVSRRYEVYTSIHFHLSNHSCNIEKNEG